MKFKSYPNSAEFKKNEVKTLQYLQARTRLLKNYSGLSTAISTAYFKYKSKKDTDFDFNFHVEFDMVVQDSFHKVIVGANVMGDFEMCTYFLAIVGKDDDSEKVIRKFHFDFAKPSIPTEQAVPTFHLQYGGKLNGEFGDYSDTYLSKWLSVPRLNFSPVNIALLLDTLFCEFDTKETNEIVQDSDWRSLIYDNEKFISSIYYNAISEHINSGRYLPNNLIRDFCYNDRIN